MAREYLSLHRLLWRAKLKYTFADSNYHYSPHSHAGLTTHLIVDGELTLWYPREEGREKKTYGVGSRVDVDAGRVHEVWAGPQGCTYVIGE